MLTDEQKEQYTEVHTKIMEVISESKITSFETIGLLERIKLAIAFGDFHNSDDHSISVSINDINMMETPEE